METKDCILIKLMKVNGLLNMNYIMLQIQRRHLQHNSGLFFDKNECIEKIELREKIEARLKKYMQNKTLLLLSQI